jgi:hypothetical protein
VARLRGNRVLWALAAASLAAGRTALSVLAKAALNRALRSAGPVRGRVGAVSLGFLRGRVALKGFCLSGGSGGRRFRFSARRAEVNLRWTSLLRGELAVDAEITTMPGGTKKSDAPPPSPAPAPAPGAPSDNLGLPLAAAWKKAARGFFPVRLGRLRLKDGCVNVTLTDGPAAARGSAGLSDGAAVSVWAEGIQLLVRNVDNRGGVASVDGAVGLMGNGGFYFCGTGRPFEDEVSFALSASLDGLDLPQFNGLFGRLAGVELDSGNLKIALEAEARDGRVEGCLTPVVDNLNAAEPASGRRVSRLRGGLLDLLAAVLENGAGRRIGAQVRFSGPVNNVKIDKTGALRSLLRNAFVEPLRPATPEEIRLAQSSAV